MTSHEFLEGTFFVVAVLERPRWDGTSLNQQSRAGNKKPTPDDTWRRKDGGEPITRNVLRDFAGLEMLGPC